MQEVSQPQIQSLGREDPLEEEMAAHSTILAWSPIESQSQTGLKQPRMDACMRQTVFLVGLSKCEVWSVSRSVVSDSL